MCAQDRFSYLTEILMQCWNFSGKLYELVIDSYLIYEGQNAIPIRQCAFSLSSEDVKNTNSNKCSLLFIMCG